jgi:peptidoglycan hydrolase CwlO-like protein
LHIIKESIPYIIIIILITILIFFGISNYRSTTNYSREIATLRGDLRESQQFIRSANERVKQLEGQLSIAIAETERIRAINQQLEARNSELTKLLNECRATIDRIINGVVQGKQLISEGIRIIRELQEANRKRN